MLNLLLTIAGAGICVVLAMRMLLGAMAQQRNETLNQLANDEMRARGLSPAAPVSEENPAKG